ncbi:hypothetical protein BH09CHL1_BH09CHL1_12880 [soil metagenome]
MNTIISKMKRAAQIVAVGTFALTLVPAHVGAAIAKPLDAGAVLLMPNEVATLGYEGYGVDFGSLYSLQQLLLQADPDLEFEPEELEAWGITSFTNLILDPIGADEQSDEPMTSFYSAVTSYETDEFAETDFEEIRSEDEADENYEIIEADAGIGDDSYVFQEVYESDENLYVTTVTVAFQIGNAVADVSVIGYDEDVNSELAIEAAEIVAEKLESLIEDGEINGDPAPGLSMNTPRYEGEDLVSGRSEYTILDGQAVISAYNPDASEMLQERADEYGMVAQYTTSLEYQLGDELTDYDPLLRPRVTLFEDADEAERYVEDRSKELVGVDNVLDVEAVDVPEDVYSDGAISAVTYETENSEQTLEVTRVFVQDGEYVYDISLMGLTSPDLDVVLSMLDDAIDCGQQGCAATLNPPSELEQYFAEQREYWVTELDSSGS